MNAKSPKSKEAIIASLLNGATVKAACKAAKTNRDTYYAWLKDDKEFADAALKAKDSRIEIVEDALFNRASRGNVTAQIFFLCNRAPERWKNVQKIEASLTEIPKLSFEVSYAQSGS